MTPIETPLRIEIILKTLVNKGFTLSQPTYHPMQDILNVHSADYVRFLEDAYGIWKSQEDSSDEVIPDTFAFRVPGRKPRGKRWQAGWYCLDTTAPIGQHTFEIAIQSAHCALSGADSLLNHEKIVYAICRPPGHHAGSDYCAGFCYLNNAAIAPHF